MVDGEHREVCHGGQPVLIAGGQHQPTANTKEVCDDQTGSRRE